MGRLSWNNIDWIIQFNMIWLYLVLSALMKLSMCQYSVGPQVYHDYNHPGSIHISGNSGPVRIIPIAAGSYQGHVPFHAPVYNVQHAPVAVHPVPVAPVVGNHHEELVEHQEPVVTHPVEPEIHPDDVQEIVEEEDAHSTERQGHNIALSVDMVPIEFNVPMLSLSIKKPVRKQPIRKQKIRNQKYAEYDEYAIRNPRLFGAKFDVDLDIDDFDFKKTTNIHSNIDAKLPALFPDSPQLHQNINSGMSTALPQSSGLHRDINSGLSTLLPHLAQLHQNLNSGVSAALPQASQLHQNINSGLSAALPEASQLHRDINSGLSAALPQLTQNIHSGLSTVLPHLPQLHQQIHSGLSAVLPHLIQKIHSGVSVLLPQSTQLNSGLSAISPQSPELHRQIHSGLAAVLPQLSQHIHSGLAALSPQSSGLHQQQQIQLGLSAIAPQLTQNIHSGLYSGLSADVPHVRRVNPDDEASPSDDDVNVEVVDDSYGTTVPVNARDQDY